MNLNTNISSDKNMQASELFIHLNNHLTLCGFNEEIKHGFLFFLGAALPAILPISIFGSIKDETVISRILNSYTPIDNKKLDTQFNEDSVIDRWFAIAESIALRQALKSEMVLSEEEMKLSAIKPYHLFEIAILKLQTDYDHHVIDYNINSLTNFYNDIFQTLGTYLIHRECSYESSYRAGIAYFQSHADGKLKLVSIQRNLERTIPPLYKALFYSPIAYILHYKQFKSNHLFSLVFFFFTAGMPDNILQPIHTWHQLVFYNAKTAQVKDYWKFEINPQEIDLVYNLAIDMRLRFPGLIPMYKMNDDLEMPELKNQKRTYEQLFNDIISAINKKYKIDASIAKWNHRGAYIQFLAILFYESCLHAMVVSKIKGQ